MKVGLLTIEQKDQLVGIMYKPDLYYNPIQDCNSDWVISKEEITNTTDPSLSWIFTIPEIDWCVPVTIPTPTNPSNYVGS